jgi:ferritin-like metal-binding protein YciE
MTEVRMSSGPGRGSPRSRRLAKDVVRPQRMSLLPHTGTNRPVHHFVHETGIALRIRRQPMGFFTKDIKTMDDLFVHTLRDIYYAENQIVKALPDMIEKASDPGLKQAFQAHLGETKTHVARVEQVFKMHGVEVKGVDCPAIDGILDEANDVAGEVDDKKVLDAALIAAAQAVEHYEMTRYGTLVAWAKQLGRSDCASVLQQNLEEEKAADQKLNTLAEGNINRKAA